MELRKEYAEIVALETAAWNAGQMVGYTIMQVALACQEIADRPPRELTDAEIAKLWNAGNYAGSTEAFPIARGIIAAHIAKQREPRVVKFRAARRKSDGYIQMVECDYVNECWEWLDADGKAQEIEVRT